MTHANIRNNTIIDFNSLYLDEDITRVETSEELYNAWLDDKNKVVYQNGKVILNPNYEEEQANKRQEAFLKDFFKIEGYGYYRRVPKGYQSAVESMNVLFNIANLTKGLQAGLIIFYEEPDFTDAEQCTEEWLIKHQIIMPAMTLEQFMQLYVAFMTAWNTTEH